MPYGLRVWGANGVLQVDYTSRLTRLIYSATAAAGANGSVVLPEINGKLTVEIAQPCGLFSGAGLPRVGHTISRSGTTISWVALSTNSNTWSDSTILVFAYS